MEVLTLLKAGIRHKKNSLIGIAIMMILISMSIILVLSVNDNCKSGIENAYNQANTGDLQVFIGSQNLTDELLSSVENHSAVKKVEDYPTICSNKAKVNGNENSNSWFLQKLRSGYQLLNDDLNGYKNEIPALKSGEIYIPQGVCTNMNCGVGDIITLYTIGGDYEFKIKGIVVEPVNGSSLIGWKQVFISDEDFDRIYGDCKKEETENILADVHILCIYKSDNVELSDAEFKRQLNLDTGIIDNAFGSLTKDTSIHYTSLFTNILCSVLMIFIGFLMIVVLIAMGHSISMEIETGYADFGILKSQGFTRSKICTVFILQYLLVQIIGILLGFVFAFPFIDILGSVFQPITGIPAENNISIWKIVLIMFGVLIISALFIMFITRKIGKISPIRAISGGHEEIYFESRIQAPISKKSLSASLAFRGFTSNKRQYIGVIAIVSILVFFMMTVMIIGNTINSKSAMESMGEIYTDMGVYFKEKINDEDIDNIEKTIKEYTDINKKYYITTMYLSIDGEELFCEIYKDSESIIGVLEGRVPLYDNEIIITDMVSEELNIKIGDRVTVSHNDKSSEYIVSGIYQNMSDTGNCFSMLLSGAEKLGIENIYYGGYVLDDTSEIEKITDVLNERYEDILKAERSASMDEQMETFTIAVNAIKAVIYIFSVVFAAVVVYMMCLKTFLKEKTNIGIYKALGFTSINLRTQFAVRFLIVAIIGSIFGTVLSLLFSGNALSVIFRTIGLSSFATEFTADVFIIPFIFICFCFFLFSYIASGRVKRIEIKELIIE